MDNETDKMIESTIRGYVFTKKCDKCGNDMNVHVLPYINFTINPEYYALAKKLDIFSAKCDKCGTLNRFTFDTMLVDEKKKWILYFLNDEANKDKFKNQIRYFMEVEINKDGNKNLDEYSTRLVTTQNDLIEKMSIFEYEMNDRIIELLKVNLYELGIFDRDVYDKIFFDSIKDDSLIFVGFNSRTKSLEPKIITLKFSFYNEIIDKLGGISELKDKDMFEEVNEKWATALMENDK